MSSELVERVFNKKYLKQEHLRGFDNYKYCCIDDSPIAVYISHPFWNWFVNFYPKWLAPNVLTLSGAALVMGCYFFVAFLDYDLTANSPDSPVEKQLPDWVWLLCSVCTFSAHLLDGTDGKQARRTGASGPTGELFDHGLDSWSTVPFTVTFFSIWGLGIYSISPVRLLGVLIAVQLVFIVTHWEKYNTGVLYLSWGYDLSQYGLSFLYLLTYLLGHKAYQFYVFGHINLANLSELGFYLCVILSFVMSGYNLYISYFVDKTGKQNSFYEFLVPMISPTVLFTVSVLWAIHSPSKVADQDPRLFLWTMGVVFANIAVHLIISQMSSTRAQVFNKQLLVYCLAAALALLNVFGSAELLVVKMLAVGLTLSHIHYGICVVRQLCDHFKIQAFSLDYLQKKSRSE